MVRYFDNSCDQHFGQHRQHLWQTLFDKIDNICDKYFLTRLTTFVTNTYLTRSTSFSTNIFLQDQQHFWQTCFTRSTTFVTNIFLQDRQQFWHTLFYKIDNIFDNFLQDRHHLWQTLFDKIDNIFDKYFFQISFAQILKHLPPIKKNFRFINV